ncbi:hypothetical protein ACIB24_14070 [Spongisporangium articulatum]|uniref:Secreted protein n=1 Tax=Spongisporangium articulatum TaxID=3362603 RepID=A0ABW8AP93_9ACTN
MSLPKIACCLLAVGSMFVAGGVGATGAAAASSGSSVMAQPAITTRITGAETACDPSKNGTPCTFTVETTTGPSTPVSAGDLATDGALTSATGQKLSAAAASGPISSRSWSQSYIAKKAGVTFWKEVHEGRFYYDGYTVWVANYRGTTNGYHTCDLGGSTWVTITVQQCGKRGERTAGMDIFDIFKVSVPAAATATHKMNYHPNGNGTVTATIPY